MHGIVEQDVNFINHCADISLESLETIKYSIITLRKEMDDIIDKDCNKKTRDNLWGCWRERVLRELENYIEKYCYKCGVSKMLELNLDVWEKNTKGISDFQKGQVLSLNKYIESYEDELFDIEKSISPLLVKLSKIRNRI